MDRTILHVDMNSFYASVECLHRPELRSHPVAVGGNVEARHGIILAKNQQAKQAGVQTGSALWEARQMCPGLIIVPPNYPLYLRYSSLARAIYQEYTQQVEPFGLDEAWLDISGQDGQATAEEIRQRIFKQLGVTVSVGVSWCKVMAKLGSDLRKPDKVTCIRRDNYAALVAPLPVSDLLYVGPATTRKLKDLNLCTIGDLAAVDPRLLQRKMGKVGLLLWRLSRGEDDEPVACSADNTLIKSVGNSVTTPRDLITATDVKLTLYALAESVGARLRERHLAGQTVEVQVRDSGLGSCSWQCALPWVTSLTQDIAQTAWQLFQARYSWLSPIRSLGLRVTRLTADRPYQPGLLAEQQQRERQLALDQTVDQLRSRYGYHCIKRGLFLTDSLGELDARGDHIIAPVAYLKGGISVAG
ncbi:DNA polymerase IV [Oscillospiraceae bacterium HV4-5-C5C]|nr:DNA polymerase IV [Oscillospiraceae bacterium HV4-5-C5C]